MSDILADYREWRSKQEDRIGTHSDRCHMWMRHERCMIHRLAHALEQERQVLSQKNLTLTDAERAAILLAVACAEDGVALSTEAVGVRVAATLRGLLERTRPDARLAALERLVAIDQELEERP